MGKSKARGGGGRRQGGQRGRGIIRCLEDVNYETLDQLLEWTIGKLMALNDIIRDDPSYKQLNMVDYGMVLVCTGD